MTTHHNNQNEHQTGNSNEQQESRNHHDTPNWARKYLDLADQAISGESNESQG